jgi:hypothetical protein
MALSFAARAFSSRPGHFSFALAKRELMVAGGAGFCSKGQEIGQLRTREVIA